MGKETEPSPSKASEKDGSSKPKKTQSSQHKSPGTKKVGSKKKIDEPSATDTIVKSPVPKKKRKLSYATEKSSSENTNKPVSNEHVYGASAVKEKSHKGNSKKTKETAKKLDEIKTVEKSRKKGRKKKEVAVSALLRKSKSRDEDSSSVVPWEENKMASSGLAHRSDHSYDERDDLFFDSDDERAADIMDNSDEDTEDASETDMATLEEEFTEMKEQMYQEKIKDLKNQLEQLKQGVHPEYMRRLKLLQRQKEDWIRMAEAFRAYELREIEKDYEREKKQAKRDLEQKKVELKDTLIQDLLEKKKSIETEKTSLELTGVNTHMLEIKTVVTRKLRRRPNDPPPAPEKKRKNNSAQLNFLLNDDQIEADLRKLNKLPKISKEHKHEKQVTVAATKSKPVAEEAPSVPERKHIYEAKIEDGRLFFDKKWYQKGQAIYLDAKDGTRYKDLVMQIASTKWKHLGKIFEVYPPQECALLHSIGSNEIWIKKIQENTRLKIYLSHLHKGKYTIKRRVTGQNNKD